MTTNTKYILVLLFCGVLLFIPFLGTVHLFDWDEINFAESAREMLVTGNFTQVQINYEPFMEKPPLFFWLQALSMKIFGVNEFAARFPNALLGIITLLTFYLFGKRLHNERFGFIWALCYMGSFLPFLYFKSGIIDPLFNYFIFLSVFFLGLSLKEHEKSTRYSFYSGLLIGLAILTKGPVGLLILLLTFFVYTALTRFKSIPRLKNLIVLFFSAFVVSSLWFGFETINRGPGFISEFITYQLRLFSTPDAGHGQPFYYHFLVVAIGCFPISILAAAELFRKNHKQDDFNLWMKILFWVVMILFSIVTTKIVHYSSLSYFPLSYLAAIFISRLYTEKLKISKVMAGFLIAGGVVFSVLLTALPLIFIYKESVYQYIKDPFAVDCLKTPVVWTGFEFLPGLLYMAAIIYAIVIILKKDTVRGFYILFISTSVSIFILLAVTAPKIESYSQKPAIKYFQKYKGQDVYMAPFGYKSYAQYFYFAQPPGYRKESKENQWLLSGEIDKPVYFVVKSTKKGEIEKFPDVKFIEQTGGFALYYREAKK